MFKSNSKTTLASNKNISLTLDWKITFQKPTYLGSTLCSRYDSGKNVRELKSESALCTSIERLELMCDALISEAAYATNGDLLEIKISGTIADKSIDECFSTVREFNAFMKVNQLL